MTTTLDDYDFESVYEYLTELLHHIDKHTNGDIVLTFIATDKDHGRNCLMGSDKENLRKILIGSLLSTIADDDMEAVHNERNGSNTKDFLKELMKTEIN